MQRSALVVSAAALAMTPLACSGQSNPSGPLDAGSNGDAAQGSNPTLEAGSNDDAGGSDASPSLFGDGSKPEAGSSDGGGNCGAAAEMVYVTGQPAELWSFWPPTFTFTKIGNLTCTSAPTHMTVDRTGTAWVAGDGNIYKTSTKDATCSALSTWTPQMGDFSDFALSFVGVTNTDSTLYLLGRGSFIAAWQIAVGQLASFNVLTGQFQIVGTPAVPGTGGDMTSNGDGTLYFLLDATQHSLYDINPANAAIENTYVVNATQGAGNQALAYFGGRFYAFEDNVVNEYDPVANTTTNIGTAPLQVTGAGQSTCVPTAVVDAGTPPPVQ